jgi:hypothetical protein
MAFDVQGYSPYSSAYTKGGAVRGAYGLPPTAAQNPTPYFPGLNGLLPQLPNISDPYAQQAAMSYSNMMADRASIYGGLNTQMASIRNQSSSGGGADPSIANWLGSDVVNYQKSDPYFQNNIGADQRLVDALSQGGGGSQSAQLADARNAANYAAYQGYQNYTQQAQQYAMDQAKAQQDFRSQMVNALQANAVAGLPASQSRMMMDAALQADNMQGAQPDLYGAFNTIYPGGGAPGSGVRVSPLGAASVMDPTKNPYLAPLATVVMQTMKEGMTADELRSKVVAQAAGNPTLATALALSPNTLDTLIPQLMGSYGTAPTGGGAGGPQTLGAVPGTERQMTSTDRMIGMGEGALKGAGLGAGIGMFAGPAGALAGGLIGGGLGGLLTEARNWFSPGHGQTALPPETPASAAHHLAGMTGLGGGIENFLIGAALGKMPGIGAGLTAKAGQLGEAGGVMNRLGQVPLWGLGKTATGLGKVGGIPENLLTRYGTGLDNAAWEKYIAGLTAEAGGRGAAGAAVGGAGGAGPAGAASTAAAGLESALTGEGAGAPNMVPGSPGFGYAAPPGTVVPNYGSSAYTGARYAGPTDPYYPYPQSYTNPYGPPPGNGLAAPVEQAAAQAGQAAVGVPQAGLGPMSQAEKDAAYAQLFPEQFAQTYAGPQVGPTAMPQTAMDWENLWNSVPPDQRWPLMQSYLEQLGIRF